jgi:hypothetical protein
MMVWKNKPGIEESSLLELSLNYPEPPGSFFLSGDAVHAD